jgi:hypothetical protein
MYVIFKGDQCIECLTQNDTILDNFVRRILDIKLKESKTCLHSKGSFMQNEMSTKYRSINVIDIIYTKFNQNLSAYYESCSLLLVH